MAPVMSTSSTAKNADEMDKVVHDFMESISNLELRNSWNGQIWLSFRNHQVYISLLLEKAYHADFRKTSLCLLFRPSKCFGKKTSHTLPYPTFLELNWESSIYSAISLFPCSPNEHVGAYPIFRQNHTYHL